MRHIRLVAERERTDFGVAGPNISTIQVKTRITTKLFVIFLGCKSAEMSHFYPYSPLRLAGFTALT
jgi:hypothetical protein